MTKAGEGLAVVAKKTQAAMIWDLVDLSQCPAHHYKPASVFVVSVLVAIIS